MTETITSEEIKRQLTQLREIVGLLKQQIPPDGATRDDGKQKADCLSDARRRLQTLALEVGAWPYEVWNNSTREASNEVLAASIHQALQTASMIDACRTAAKNHEIALKAMKGAAESQHISKGAMIAAWVAAVGAWAAVILPPIARLIMSSIRE